jgi:hypothetical protein
VTQCSSATYTSLCVGWLHSFVSKVNPRPTLGNLSSGHPRSTALLHRRREVFFRANYCTDQFQTRSHSRLSVVLVCLWIGEINKLAVAHVWAQDASLAANPCSHSLRCNLTNEQFICTYVQMLFKREIGARSSAEAKRVQILEAALRVVAEGGPDAITFRRVAADAEVPLGLLTYHFDSREDLLRQAFRLYLSEAVAFMSGIEDEKSPHTPESVVDMVLEITRREFSDDPAMVRVESWRENSMPTSAGWKPSSRPLWRPLERSVRSMPHAR